MECANPPAARPGLGNEKESERERERARERKPSGTRNAIMHLIHIAIMSADLSPEFCADAPPLPLPLRHHRFTRTGGGFWFIYLDYFFLPAESRFDLTVIKIKGSRSGFVDLLCNKDLSSSYDSFPQMRVMCVCSSGHVTHTTGRKKKKLNKKKKTQPLSCGHRKIINGRYKQIGVPPGCSLFSQQRRVRKCFIPLRIAFDELVRPR